MRVLYFTALAALNGRGYLRGRQFAAQLKGESAAFRLRHQWEPDRAKAIKRANAKNPTIAQDMTDDAEIDDFAPDVIFFESGIHSFPGRWRVPSEVTERLVRRGVVVIVDGFEANIAGELDDGDLAAVWSLFGARPYLADASRNALPYLRDFQSNGGAPSEVVCRPSELANAEWVRPTFDGIDSLLAISPLALMATPGASVLVTAERTCNMLSLDRYVGEPWAYPWGTVRQLGYGFLVLLGAGVSTDTAVELCPDNARWLIHLMRFLVDESHRHRDLYAAEFEANLATSRFDGEPERTTLPSELLRRGESNLLEFKSSAAKSLENESIPEAVVIEQVVKTVAGFLNAEGGTLLIGVRDDATVVGVGRDLAFKNLDLDRYLLFLTDRLTHSFTAGVVATHTRLRTEEIGGEVVVAIEVEPSSQPVYVNAKGRESFFVRVNNSTRELPISEIYSYIGNRWSK